MTDILSKSASTVSSPLNQTDMGMGFVNASGVHSANRSGGVLQADQSRQFLDYIFDELVLGKDGRRVTMRANTAEYDKVQVGERLVSKAAQATGPGANKEATFTKVEVVTTKFRLDFAISTEALEDNIEGSAFEDHLVRLMTAQFANDIEDIAVNGVSGAGTGDEYGNTLDGFIKLVDSAAGTASSNSHFGPPNPVDNTASVLTASGLVTDTGSAVTFFENLYNKLPRKFQQRRDSLKFYASTQNVQTLLHDMRKLGDAGVPESIAAGVLEGNRPRVGGAGGYTTSIFGIPVLEVPSYPDTYIDLTFPQNRIWGFQRDVTVHREFIPKRDEVEYTVYVRFGVNIEEMSAVAFGSD